MAVSLHPHAVGLTWCETGRMSRSAHALRDRNGDGDGDGETGHRVWLIDPFEDGPALAAAAELGPPAGVIQLLDRHNRECAAIAARLGVPHLRLPAAIPDSPFTVLRIIDRPGWHELALWWEAESTLVVAEAVGTAPLFALGRRAGVHPMLRLTPPRRVLSGDRRPQRLLVGHGPPLTDGAQDALAEALAHSVSDIPQIVLRLPGLIRGG